MKGKKLVRTTIALIALVAMLLENTYSVFASATGEQVLLPEETLLTDGSGNEDTEVIEENNPGNELTMDMSNEPELLNDSDAEGAEAGMIPAENGYVGETLAVDSDNDGNARISILSDGVKVMDSDEITLYVNTDQMNSSDSFRINIEGGETAVYDSRLNGTLYKNSSDVYRITGIGGEAVTIKTAGMSEGLKAVYSKRNDGSILFTLISADSPKIEKKLRVTDKGYEVKGSGYDDITVSVDTSSLTVSTRYNLYIETKAAVRYNGDPVNNGVIEALSKSDSSIRLSNLNNEAFTIYIEGQNTRKLKAEYSIDSVDNGAVSATLALTDEDFVAEREDEEETEEEPTKRVYSYSDSDVQVTATLQFADAIPDDADFVVTKITKDTSGYNYDAYMQAINNNTDSITGDGDSELDDSDVLLYDIAFISTDEDGNRTEIQPAEGSVQISIKFMKDQLKEELNAEEDADVKVVHLPLKDGVKDSVDTTADATDISAADIRVQVVGDSTSVSSESTDFTLTDFSVIGLTADGKLKPGPSETFKSVLGNASMYGIVANEMTLGGHLESNFATGKLNGNENVQACKNDGGNPGVTYIGEYTGSNFKMNKNGNQSTVLIYTTEAAKNNFGFNMLSESSNPANGISIDTSSYSSDQIKKLVSGMVSQAETRSEQLAGVNAYAFSKVASIGNSSRTINLKKNGSGEGTYYINFEKGEYADSKMLELILDEGQNIVFNIPDSEVNFQQFRITIGNKTWTTSGNSDEDLICQTVIFNCPNAQKAATVSPVAGTFVVPNAVFETQSVSAGWVIADTISRIGGAEWHCVWHDMPPAIGSDVEIEASKTVDFQPAGKNQKFWFDLYSYDSKTGKSTLLESVQNNGNSVKFGKIYFNEEGTYEYRLAEREADDIYVHDPYEYYITYKVELDKGLNQYVVKNKTVKRKNRQSDEQQAEDFNGEIKFNNQTRPKAPFDFSITKLFYQNDGTEWDTDRFTDIFPGYGQDWPDGAVFTFNIESFDGGTTNTGIRKDPPMPEKKQVTLTKDKRTDTFGRVFFEADTNPDNYQNWEKSYNRDLNAWVFTRIYMYKVTEVIPAEEDRIPGVQYTERPVYVKLFIDSYYDSKNSCTKVIVSGKASYVNDNSIPKQGCFVIGDADLEFVNAYYPGSLTVKKAVKDSNCKVVENNDDFYVVVYRKTSSGSKVYYGTDGSEYLGVHTEIVKGNSEIKFAPLPVGNTYYVYETDAFGTEVTADGTEYKVIYDGLGEGNSVKLTSGDKDKTACITNKRRNGKLQLIKYDAENADKLAGAEFELYKDGKRYPDENTTYTTGNEGAVTVENLPWGTYFFREITAPKGYVLPEGDAANTSSATIDGKTVKELNVIEMKDHKIRGDLILYKIDDDGNKLEGATFTLYRSDESKDTKSPVKTSGSTGSYKYDESGEVQELSVNSEGILNVTGLPYGTYRIYEEKAPDGYNKDDRAKKFEIGANRAVAELSFVNSPIKANVEFIKVDAEDKPLEGVTFVLYKKINGEFSEVNRADSGFNGHVLIEGLGKGEYYFEETVPEGYEAVQADTYFEITEADNNKTITLPNITKKIDGLSAVVNTPLKGSVELFKYVLRTGEKKGLEGAEFELYKYTNDSKEKIGKVYVTDGNGMVTVDGLDWGSYYFIETKAPVGFNPVADPVYFNITKADAAAGTAE